MQASLAEANRNGPWPAREVDAVALRCAIVDDNVEVLESARTLLESQGVSVVGVATTGREAVSVMDALRPDVMLVDIFLGTESGFDLVRRLAAGRDAACCRTILISTCDEEDFADLIAASPAVGFLPKAALSAEAIRGLLAERKGLSG